MKNVLRAAILGAAVAAMAGCTGASNLLAQIPTGSASPTSTTPTTASSSAPTTPTTTTSSAPTTTSSVAPTTSTAASCTRQDPGNDKKDLLEGTAYGKFNGQHVPLTWASAYSTEKEVWDAINSNSSLKPEDFACFQKFYPGAYSVWKELVSKYGS